MTRVRLALAVTFMFLGGAALGATRCEELAPSLSEGEYQEFIANAIKSGNIPPGTYQERKRSRCYIEPDRGLVSDEETARAIALAVLKAHFEPKESFGRLVLAVETDTNGDWIIAGHYPGPGVRQRVPTVWISRKDGRILGFWYD